MSNLAQELDTTLKALDESAASSLSTIVREAMHLVRSAAGAKGSASPEEVSQWMQRLAERGAQLATGREGAPMQVVMDDLRG